MVRDPIWIPQHLLGVSLDARPLEVSNAVNDFGGTRAAANEVATVHDQIWTDLFQIRHHRHSHF